MFKIKKNAVLFTVGGVGYGIIEILWRGHTHWTMIIAGGICFVLISKIAEGLKEKPLICKAFVSAVGVTFIEFIFGVVCNLVFQMKIWDYSKMPFNLLGQICPFFTAAWCGLGFVLVPLAEFINAKLNSCKKGAESKAYN